MDKPKYLLNSQANELFMAIAKAGFDPADFEWQEIALPNLSWGGSEDYMADALVYRVPESFFAFGQHYVLYSPGYQTLRDQVSTDDWSQTVQRFGSWLRNIKREAVPSLWDSIVESTTVSAGGLDTPRTRFTAEEQADIHARLEAMNQQIAALDTLTQGQKQLLGTELQNVDEAKNRMNRSEWFRFAVGSIMAVLLASDLQHSVAASLMRWAVSAFQSMVTGHPMPLLLP